MTRSSFASVLAAGVETRYLRSGCGPAVVFLRPAGPGLDEAAELLVRNLSTRYRVIVPEIPSPVPGAHAGRDWMMGVLDGLGLHSVVLLSTMSLRDLASPIQHADPERIAGVVFADLRLETQELIERVGGAIEQLSEASRHA